MREILTRKQEIDDSVAKFRGRIASISGKKPKPVEWEFPSNEKRILPTYSINSDLGRFSVGLGRFSNRIAHLFRFGEKQSQSPDVEVNIPTRQNRRVAGAYLRDENEIWLCTRGHFTAQRANIPRGLVFDHFDKWLVETTDVDRVARVIPIAALDSRTLADDLAYFMKAVVDLKASYRAGGGKVIRERAHWHEGPEHEGPIKKKVPAKASVYDYLHGPMCNALESALQGLIRQRGQYTVRRNRNIDRAIVDERGLARAIFEVKTSSGLSEQLYAAIGQLLYYKHCYGDSKTSLFLILPRESITNGLSRPDFFAALDIGVIVGSGAEFRGLDKTSLEDIVTACLT